MYRMLHLWKIDRVGDFFVFIVVVVVSNNIAIFHIYKVEILFIKHHHFLLLFSYNFVRLWHDDDAIQHNISHV